MLKTTSAAGPAASAEVENEERDSKEIQVNEGKIKPTQKSRKGQKTAKSKKWIQAEKSEASRAKNLSSQSGSFFPLKARKTFTELRQAFVEALILNHFDPEYYFRIKMDAFGYAIGKILSELTSDNLG